jgi:hypothetical protein
MRYAGAIETDTVVKAKRFVAWLVALGTVGAVGFILGWNIQERATAQVMLAAIYKDATTTNKLLDALRNQNIEGVEKFQEFLLETTREDLARLLAQYPHLRKYREAQEAQALLSAPGDFRRDGSISEAE